MKIVNKNEFLLMPENTLFAKYYPCVIGSLQIKGESIANDFYVQYISDSIDANDTSDFIDKLESAEKGETIMLDLNIQSRDGLFDDNQLFVVYDNQDVTQIIERLKLCLE